MTEHRVLYRVYRVHPRVHRMKRWPWRDRDRDREGFVSEKRGKSRSDAPTPRGGRACVLVSTIVHNVHCTRSVGYVHYVQLYTAPQLLPNNAQPDDDIV